MKEYTDLTTLKAEFVSGEFDLPQEVMIEGHVYHPRTSSTTPFINMVSSKAKGVVVYESENAGWLLFLWGAHNNSVVPYDVRKTTRPIVEKEEIQDRIIADKVKVHFLNMPVAKTIVAKVDTGAEMCSLHAEQVQINRGQGTVSFSCPELANSTLTVPLVDRQAVKTSGGDTTYRAVIKTTIKVHGKILKDVLINLNDRSEMQEPMLLGQNALQDGNFLIDPNIIKEAQDLLTEEFLDELKHDKVEIINTISPEASKKIYEALTEVGDISIADVIKVLRTQILKNLDEVSY